MGTSYNGWRNYPTWAVGLWLGNDPVTDADSRAIAEIWNDRTAQEGGTLCELADTLRDYVEAIPEVAAASNTASVASDLLGFALDSADWYEIAEHYASDLLGERTESELERRRTLAVAGGTQ